VLQQAEASGDADSLFSVEQGRKGTHSSPELSSPASKRAWNNTAGASSGSDSTCQLQYERFLQTQSGNQQRKRAPDSALPSPPPRVYQRPLGSPFTIDVPTSEQTYGETNQLLQITPDNASPPFRIHADYTATPTHRQPGDAQHDRLPSQTMPIRTPLGGIFHETGLYDEIASPDEDAPLRPESPLLPPMWIDSEFPPGRGRLPRRNSNAIRQIVQRSSSAYPDDESAWETQASLSQGDVIRTSQDSYANTTDHDYSRAGSLEMETNRMVFGPDFQEYRPSRRGRSIAIPPVPPMPELETANFSIGDSVAHRLRVRRAMQLLRMKQEENRPPQTRQERRERRLRSLEREDIRQTDPLAIREAAGEVAAEMKTHPFMNAQRLNAQPSDEVIRMRPGAARRPTISSTDSFSHIAVRGVHPGAYSTASFESVAPIEGELVYSDSSNTFRTVRTVQTAVRDASPAMSGRQPTVLWSPISTTRPAAPAPHSLRRVRSFSGSVVSLMSSPSGINPFLDQTPRSQRRNPAAIDGQIELQELRIVRDNPPRRPGRMSDRELYTRAVNWRNTPHRRPTSSRMFDSATHAAEVEVEQGIFSPGPPQLFAGRQSVADATLASQVEHLSQRYQFWTAWFPFAALAFSFGAFDRLAA